MYKCRTNNLKEPIFEESGLFFKVTIFNSENEGETYKTPIKPLKLSENEMKIVRFLESNKFVTNAMVRELIGKKDTATKTLLGKLVEKNIIMALGERKNRIYKLLKR